MDKKENNIRSMTEDAYSLRELGAASPLPFDVDCSELLATGRATVMTPHIADAKLNAKKSGEKRMSPVSENSSESTGKSFPPHPVMPQTAAASRTEKTTPTVWRSKEDGTGLEEMPISRESMPAAIDASPQELSTGPLLNTEQEKLASVSLIDDVTGRLHLQMKRLTLSHEDVTTSKDALGASHSERQRVGLALKTASEIGKMIRLKLDAVKVFRDLE